MKILGIETSCDETAAAVVSDGREILSNVVVSQIDIFKEYGGVIPEVAARSHLEAILPVIERALTEAKCGWEEIDAIAVTHAPGLLGSLLIGTLTARTLAILHGKPLYAVHHLKSHVYANWLNVAANISFSGATCPPSASYAGAPGKFALRAAFSGPAGIYASGRPNLGGSLRKISSAAPCFPLLALVVSGGHTQILHMRGHNQFEIIGTTVDDAVGECFDKVAKILGLPYPGGPAIASAAFSGDPNRYRLPHPKVQDLDFSFSGLKTAVLRAVQKEVNVPISYPSHRLKDLLTPQQVADFAASFQRTAVEILCEKLGLAIEQYPEVESIVVAGGVSANEELRKTFMFCSGPRPAGPSPWAVDARPRAAALRIPLRQNINVFFPSPSLSGDNGAMVAAAAYYEIEAGVSPTDPYKLNIYPRISIES